MSDYTQTLNTLERMDLNDPVPTVSILPDAIQDFLLEITDDPSELTVWEAMRSLKRYWGTSPHVIYGLNGPDTYFDTGGDEQANVRAWLTDNGIDPATVLAQPLYFDHSNNVLTYAEYDHVRTPQMEHMAQHTMQGAPIAGLLSAY